MSDNKRRKRHSAFALAVASGRTVRDAAKQANISEATAYRWMQDRDIQAEIERQQAQMFDQAAGRLAEALTNAVECLSGLLEAESESVRLGAARSIIDLAFRSRDLLDHEDRLQQLEDMLCAKAD